MEAWHAYVGASRQPSFDTVIGTVQHGWPIIDGGVHELELDQQVDELTGSRRRHADVIRTAAEVGIEFTTHLWPRSFPLLLAAILQSPSTTGSNPYTHTTREGTTTNRLTFHGQMDGEYVNVRNCRARELSLSWDGPGLAEVVADYIGTDAAYGASPWTPAVDSRVVGAALRGAGGLFQVDVDGSSPADARVTAGELTLRHLAAPTYTADSVLPVDVPAMMLEIDVSLTVVPTDLADWRTIITASPSGSAVAEARLRGSVALRFDNPLGQSVRIDLPRVSFLADWPDADVESADELAIVLDGAVLDSAGTAGSSLITVTTINDHASYPTS